MSSKIPPVSPPAGGGFNREKPTDWGAWNPKDKGDKGDKDKGGDKKDGGNDGGRYA